MESTASLGRQTERLVQARADGVELATQDIDRHRPSWYSDMRRLNPDEVETLLANMGSGRIPIMGSTEPLPEPNLQARGTSMGTVK